MDPGFRWRDEAWGWVKKITGSGNERVGLQPFIKKVAALSTIILSLRVSYNQFRY